MNEPKQIDDGGPAIPLTEACAKGLPTGMTLRQWYAGQALCGVLSCSQTSGTREAFAEEAFKYADAMIAAEKDQNQ